MKLIHPSSPIYFIWCSQRNCTWCCMVCVATKAQIFTIIFIIIIIDVRLQSIILLTGVPPNLFVCHPLFKSSRDAITSSGTPNSAFE